MSVNLPLPTSPEMLMKRLTSMGIAHILHRHRAVFTCEESAHLKEIIPGLHVKNLFLKDKKDRMALVVLPDEMSVDLKALAPAIGLDRISFGSPERLYQYLGVLPGSVCPFAAMNDTQGKVKVVLERSLANAQTVVGHPMMNTMSLALAGPDLVRFLESVNHTPQIMDFNAFAPQQKPLEPAQAAS